MEAMQKHFQHAKTVASTCGMLRQLAKSDDVKTLLVSIDGLDAIANVLEHHKQSSQVCTQVRKACTNACHDSGVLSMPSA